MINLLLLILLIFNVDRLEIVGVTPLIDTLKWIGGWPMVRKTWYNGKKFSWEDSLVKLLGVLNVASVFHIYVNPDTKESTTNTIYVREMFRK